MPFAAAISLGSKPVSQILYGAASDSFSHSVCWAVIPTAAALCVIGLSSKWFFAAGSGKDGPRAKQTMR